MAFLNVGFRVVGNACGILYVGLALGKRFEHFSGITNDHKGMTVVDGEQHPHDKF